MERVDYWCAKCKERWAFYKLESSPYLTDFLGLPKKGGKIFKLCHKCALEFTEYLKKRRLYKEIVNIWQL